MEWQDVDRQRAAPTSAGEHKAEAAAGAAKRARGKKKRERENKRIGSDRIIKKGVWHHGGHTYRKKV